MHPDEAVVYLKFQGPQTNRPREIHKKKTTEKLLKLRGPKPTNPTKSPGSLYRTLMKQTLIIYGRVFSPDLTR